MGVRNFAMASFVYATYGAELDPTYDHTSPLLATAVECTSCIVWMPQLETFDVEVLEGGVAHRLRAKEGRHRYGVKLQDTHLKEAIRRDNLLLVKTYQFLTTQILKGIRVACVLRKSSGNECSPLDLDECDEFVSKNHLSRIDLDACYFESGHHANFVVITQNCDSLSGRQCLHIQKCCSEINSYEAQRQSEQNWCLPEKALLWLVLKL